MNWKQSNSSMFAERQAYFLNKYGEQDRDKKIERINAVQSDKYACHTINEMRKQLIKYGHIDPEVRFGEFSQMLSNGEF